MIIEDKCTQAYFIQSVQNHTAIIKQDDGVYRDILCRNPASNDMRFGVKTWPRHLCFYGDMGCWVFEVGENPFGGFKGWSEKITATDIHGGTDEYSSELLEEAVKEYYYDYLAEKGMTEEDKIELWDNLKTSVLGARCEYEARENAENFSWRGKYCFHDFAETRLTRKTFRYIWSCYAIAWAVGQYDLIKGVGK